MILVTGATGLSGQIIVRELAHNHVPAKALVRNARKASATGIDKLPGIDAIEGDMRAGDDVKAALDGVTRVLLISSGTPDMRETQCSFIDLCKQAGVPHIVKFSGAESGIGFDPAKFRFTRMHEEIEDHLEGSGLAWTHLRPSQFMQVYLREAPTISRDGELRLPLADIELAPVAIEDIAKVACRLLREGGHESESLNMTGPEALTMNEVAERISATTGRPVRYVPISWDERRSVLLGSGAPADFVDALDEQLQERLRRPKSRVNLATHDAFGVRPTSFAEFARTYARAFSG
ncbi:MULTISPECIES: SDR family oxidoreductase [unclassified Mesorhizobium]|uniref:SDR family oxidoreductase n=1 Tax=unclassified Mesorhizobium TaxID=325217 RepID=UPI000FCAE441|nr:MULTISPECIES: SDR family oxidoreductase [unclassified Mesorhizobium]TGP21940.1 SDR family oxidoreductase [Mesorhizobium sp. M1D.F.Ca.ET.231.01.1.1]TGP30325.1 SDR family oxidoreductase [Mesorhizobium sp. M1D.F.Ca.ET.234.01.1.1]TGS44401.1 SDR family oxidoreductase [Mesorhizobium sp. M1D.F.Ca.ET.184.01.1.1]TGS60441.1 SDR family oxidoreductase [Mesorhizobium sp. M1D.F.Ca.ET.183.01.1.1]